MSKRVLSRGWLNAADQLMGLALILSLLTSAAPAHAQETTNAALFQYEIFYNGVLEFSMCPAMTINGQVHANGDIYLGTAAALLLNTTVTLTGNISYPANDGHLAFIPPGNTTFAADPPYLAGGPYALPAIPTNNLHAIIDLPPPGEDPDSAMGQARLYNQAQTILLVSNTTVTFKIQAAPGVGQVPGADTNAIIVTSVNTPTALGTNFFGWLTTTNVFCDQRELWKSNLTTQIDIRKYALWALTNGNIKAKLPAQSGTYPDILYVADYRTNNFKQLTVVRLTNGLAPPANGGLGFTLVTPNPLYIWGDYNCTNSSYLATSNTSATVPCALVSDALTILSSAWQDNLSWESIGYFGRNKASPATTINAAILTGDVPSTGTGSSQYSGGVHNLPRLLEDWSSSQLWLNTSLACLYTSSMATNPLLYQGTDYNPPTRHFSFDTNFAILARQPPGTPLLIYGPSITRQPTNEPAILGSNAILSVAVSGTAPFSYQWQFNSTNLVNATNDTLVLTNVTIDAVGTYAVTVTNFASGTASSNADLSVYATPAASLDAPNFTADGVIQFSVDGVPGWNYTVEASTDLVDWIPYVTNAAPYTFTNSDNPWAPQLFYRATLSP